MILKVMAILDKATKVYNTPFFQLTRAEAIRNFQNMANDETTQVNKSPNDFELYSLGEFDNTTGKFVEDHDYIGTASQFFVEDEEI